MDLFRKSSKKGKKKIDRELEREFGWIGNSSDKAVFEYNSKYPPSVFDSEDEKNSRRNTYLSLYKDCDKWEVFTPKRTVDDKLDEIIRRLDKIDTRIDKIDERLGAIEGFMDSQITDIRDHIERDLPFQGKLFAFHI